MAKHRCGDTGAKGYVGWRIESVGCRPKGPFSVVSNCLVMGVSRIDCAHGVGSAMMIHPDMYYFKSPRSRRWGSGKGQGQESRSWRWRSQGVLKQKKVTSIGARKWFCRSGRQEGSRNVASFKLLPARPAGLILVTPRQSQVDHCDSHEVPSCLSFLSLFRLLRPMKNLRTGGVEKTKTA